MILPPLLRAPTIRAYLLDFANQVPPAGGAVLKPDEEPNVCTGRHSRPRWHALAVILMAISVALTTALSAEAARAPTQAEEGAIWSAVVKTIKSEPRTCIGVSVAISTVNPSYAIGVPLWSNLRDCQKYAGNGYDILKRTGASWRSVFTGSDPPNCGEIPTRVVRELTGLNCLKLTP